MNEGSNVGRHVLDSLEVRETGWRWNDGEEEGVRVGLSMESMAEHSGFHTEL